LNKRPIEEAKDRDLRLSQAALQRAAQRARELAAATGTALVVSRNGVIEYLTPNSPENQSGTD
jgi:hypothetical protein